MFTGIIKEIGYLKKKTRLSAGNVRLTISCRKLHPLPGESVSVNGVCLTVTKNRNGAFKSDVIPETLAKTNFKGLPVGAPLNLEPSLRIGDSLSGHIVSGHVDTAAKVLCLGKIQRGIGLKIELSTEIKPFIAKKGSVALNGVSLTVTDVREKSFFAALTPYTLKHTNLSALKKGESVNIEIDSVARYVERLKTQNSKLKMPTKIAIIVSKFNSDVTEKLLASAKKALSKNKMKNFEVFAVPGAFEIPYRAATLSNTGKYGGIIALGCVIKGETDHYRAVCDGVTYGIQKVSIENRIPVMLGILMCETKTQALTRADKGAECARGLVKILRTC